MLDRALVTPEQLREYFEAISGRLYRKPAVDEGVGHAHAHRVPGAAAAVFGAS